MPDLHTNINIHETINSGQIFLWENYRDTWFVIDGHDIIMARQTPFKIMTFSKKSSFFKGTIESFFNIFPHLDD